MTLKFLEQFCHQHGILSAGNTDSNFISFPDKLIFIDCFCKFAENRFMEFFADALFNIRISGCLLKMVQQPFIITAFQTAGIKSKPGKQFCLIGTDHTALAVYNDLFFCLKFVFSLNQLICRNIEGIFHASDIQQLIRFLFHIFKLRKGAAFYVFQNFSPVF